LTGVCSIRDKLAGNWTDAQVQFGPRIFADRIVISTERIK